MNNGFKYPPHKFTVFFSPIEPVMRAIEIMGNIWKCFEKTTQTNDISAVLDSKFDEFIYDSGQTHVIYTPISNRDITIFISNQSDGASSLIHMSNKKMDLESINLEISLPENFYKRSAFTYYKNGKGIRVVYAMQDPNWIFFETGEPLSFEDVSLYKAKRKKDRMNKGIIVEYMRKLGVDLYDPNLWKNIGIAYEITEVKYPRKNQQT